MLRSTTTPGPEPTRTVAVKGIPSGIRVSAVVSRTQAVVGPTTSVNWAGGDRNGWTRTTTRSLTPVGLKMLITVRPPVRSIDRGRDRRVRPGPETRA